MNPRPNTVAPDARPVPAPLGIVSSLRVPAVRRPCGETADSSALKLI